MNAAAVQRAGYPIVQLSGTGVGSLAVGSW